MIPRNLSDIFVQASYEAGDHIGIVAENETAVIERAAAALGLSPSLKFSLHCPANNPHNLSAPFAGENCYLPYR